MREGGRREGGREGGREGNKEEGVEGINSLSTVHTLSRPTMFGCDPRLASCSMSAMRALTSSSEAWSLQHFTATSMALSLLIPLAVPLYRTVEKPSYRISDSWRRSGGNSHLGSTSSPQQLLTESGCSAYMYVSLGASRGSVSGGMYLFPSCG